jgi:hypothetical protein
MNSFIKLKHSNDIISVEHLLGISTWLIDDTIKNKPYLEFLYQNRRIEIEYDNDNELLQSLDDIIQELNVKVQGLKEKNRKEENGKL